MTFPNVKYLVTFSLVLIAIKSFSQDGPESPTTDGRIGSGLIITGVPFLLISPDARAGAMGDVGAATSPDANSMHWNPAKLAFMENDKGVSLSYSPWLQRLVPDINLAYLSGYYRLDDRNTIGASLRYFSLGQIELIDAERNKQGTHNPNEFAVDGTLARQFGENFSLGTAIRFVYSALSNGLSAGQQTRPATALAADVSGYFKKETVLLGSDARVALGLDISNIGNKISYSDGGRKIFIPTNFRLGTSATFLNGLNEFTAALDLNKLLVPTPPIRDTETGKVIAGKDDDRSVPAGIFGSFNDAPGGFSEEFKEINYSLGLEYLYNKQFAMRAGYFYENPQKGDRQYITLGAGLRYNYFNLDFAYLLANQQKSPLANTLRFSLVFNFLSGKTTPNAN